MFRNYALDEDVGGVLRSDGFVNRLKDNIL